VSFKNIHNEKELLLKIADGDRDAFKDLYGHYFPIVQGYVMLFEPTKAFLDELTQDIFIKIWDKRDKLAGVESFKSYLFLMTRNTIFNYFRSRKVHQRTRELGESDEASETGVDDPENRLLYKQLYNIAAEAIEKLPEGRRKILKMSIDRGLSLDEIAAELNISRSGVKKQLYAGTAFVRQYLQDHGEMSLLLFVFLSLFDQ